MAITHLSDHWASGDAGGVNLLGVDTTTADFIVGVSTDYYTPADITDSEGCTWEYGSIFQTASGATLRAFWTVPGVKVSASHEFYCAGAYTTVFVSLFSGVHQTDPFTTQEMGDDADGSEGLPGTLTPSEDNCLVVGGLGLLNFTANDPVVDTSGALASNFVTYNPGLSLGGAFGWAVQTTAAAVTPVWDFGNTISSATNLLVFRPAAGGGGGAGQPAMRRWGGVPHLGTQKLRGGHRGGPWGYRRQEAA